MFAPSPDDVQHALESASAAAAALSNAAQDVKKMALDAAGTGVDPTAVVGSLKSITDQLLKDADWLNRAVTQVLQPAKDGKLNGKDWAEDWITALKIIQRAFDDAAAAENEMRDAVDPWGVGSPNFRPDPDNPPFPGTTHDKKLAPDVKSELRYTKYD